VLSLVILQLINFFLFITNAKAYQQKSSLVKKKSFIGSATMSQFHQHFASNFFVQKCFAPLFSTYGIALNFFVELINES